MLKKTSIMIVIAFFSTLRSEKTIELKNVSNSIIIDGVIDESEWADAKTIGDFVEITPGENLPAVAQTKVYVTYDSKHLYIAFNAFDDQGSIRANQSKRDDISDDDNIQEMMVSLRIFFPVIPMAISPMDKNLVRVSVMIGMRYGILQVVSRMTAMRLRWRFHFLHLEQQT